MEEKNSNLYENYRNYIYKVSDENYILFNPVIQSWTVLDGIGREIVEAVRNNNNVECAVQELSEKFNTPKEKIYNDAVPFIRRLTEKRFFLNEMPQHEKTWMDKELSVAEARVKYPIKDIYIGITDACNLKCIYCFNQKTRYDRLKGSLPNMSDDDIISVIRQYHELGGEGVVFTGGEPTLNPHLVDYVKCTVELGLIPKIITNGTNLLNVDLKELLKYMNDISISLDSVIVEELNSLWNVECSSKLNDLLTALSIINEISKNKKTLVNIVVAPIVSSININSLYKIIECIKEKMPNCNIAWNISSFKKIGDPEIDEKLSVTSEDYYANYLNAWRTVAPKADDMMLRYFASTEGGKRDLKNYPNFIACSPALFVNTKGFIYPCQGLEGNERLLGDVRNTSLKEAFESAIMDDVIQNAMINSYKKCSKCEIRYLCTLRGGVCTKDDDVYKCKERMHKIMFYKSKIKGKISGKKIV